MDQPASGSGEPSQTPTDTAQERLSGHTLASFRSLIINPSTPASLISSILDTLTGYLQPSRDPHPLRHTLKLLAELAHRDAEHSAVASQSVRAFLLSTESTSLAAESLDALASILGNDLTVDDRFFVSLCFDASHASRLWLLRNAERFGIRPYVLFTVFSGFTKDPYPYVRKVALDGLSSLSKSGAIMDRSFIEGCYYRAVELLGDAEACVRSAAISAVSEWGQMLVASTPGTGKMKLADEVFILLSSMVRDMSVEVRVAAFDALRNTAVVSEDVLLQSLSKKLLGDKKGEKRPGKGSGSQIKVLASTAAGAFVHGLEDEFSEVRKSACYSMQKLASISSEFAGKAINLLTDMLNDDSMAVRLQALETMVPMASRGHLSLEDTQMRMFLGSLSDNSSMIRDGARKVLKSVKLKSPEHFKLSVDGLIENLQRHPEDECEIFSALFQMGRHHGSFTESRIYEVFQEIEPASDGEFGFDSPKVAAFLVLAVAAPLCPKTNNCKIPAPIFSYTVTILGRISRALADEVDQDTLLAYLSHCSRCSTDPLTNSKQTKKERKMKRKEIAAQKNCGRQSLTGSEDGFSPVQMEFDDSISYAHRTDPGNLPSPLAKFQLGTDDRFLNSMNIILAKIEEIWSLVKLGLLNQGMRILRACNQEIAVFFSEPSEFSPSLAFVALYLRTVKLLARIFVHFLPGVNHCNYRVGNLDLLLEKLDRRLRDMRCRFTGQSKEEEIRILELVLVSFVLRVSKAEICCCVNTTRKLTTVFMKIEHLQEEASIRPSSFLTELKKLMCNTLNHPSSYRKALDHLCLGKYELSGRLEYVSAELAVPGNNSENPLYFVRGLPVAIPLSIVLSNISRESKLWLKITIGEESRQLLFLDAKLYSGSKKFNYNAPFYRTPEALSFTLKICIGMECVYESVDVAARCGGPRHELVFLTPEVDVFFSSARDGIIR